jgi:transcriptional regulator of acetoin/glycerol metabolism
MLIAWPASSAPPTAPRFHADRVSVALQGALSTPTREQLVSSWHRSAHEHALDPEHAGQPVCLGEAELRRVREPLAPLLAIAEGELVRLQSIVRRVGYSVVLCNAEGIEIELRTDDAQRDLWHSFGARPGADWSERSIGTNAIGTCIAERSPVLIHRDEHFAARFRQASCAATPLFGADDALLGVIDLSCIDPKLSERSHALTVPLLEATAHALEERLFRERYSQSWVLAIMMGSDAQLLALLAVDRDQQVIGVDRHIREALGLPVDAVRAGLALSDLFNYDRAAFKRQDGGDALLQLTSVSGDQSFAAMLSAPSVREVSSLTALQAVQRTRSRRGLLADVQRRVSSQSEMAARGGLSAAVLQRVHQHVERHLGETISLDALARAANLSVHHFARAFKQAVGLPPHRYLLERRVERAKGLLLESERPMAEIARMVGFSDQSHFARHFNRLAGCTPREYRRTAR